MKKNILTLLGAAIAGVGTLFAAPTSTRPQQPMQFLPQLQFEKSLGIGAFAPEGSEAFRSPAKVDKLGNSLWDNTDGHDTREVDTRSEMHVLVILADFQNQEFTVSDDPRQMVSDMLNKPGFNQDGAWGSVFDFYHDNSHGLFKPVFDVYGPVTMPNNHAWYAGLNIKEVVNHQGVTESVLPAALMIEEACRQIDDDVDFSKYDANGDGYVDFVYVFYAGKGATTGGTVSQNIWPHASELMLTLFRTADFDGVKVNRYTCSQELNANRKLAGPGMFIHEFSHVLGLPDLYDTANNGTATSVFDPGYYSTMCAGNYNNDMYTPAAFSAYERYSLEWMRPVTITGGGNFTMLPITSADITYKIPSRKTPTEYFLFEARAPQSWDTFLPGFGMLAWHIDFDLRIWDKNTVNTNATHQRVDIIEADCDLSDASRSGDTFPGSAGICELNADTNPGLIAWDRRDTGFEFEKITTHPDGSVSFTVLAEDGSEMEEAILDAPTRLRLSDLSDTSFTLTWNRSEGADAYRLCVFEADSFRDGYFRTFADGYCFKNLGDTDHATVEGLKPGVTYGITLYAANDFNTARCEEPLTVTTAAADFARARPQLSAYAADGAADIRWAAMPEAESYNLTVATRTSTPSQSTFKTGFEKHEAPEGWNVYGELETKSNYCGEAAPSIKLGLSGHSLQTEAFDRDIASISFWSRIRFNGDVPGLDIYGFDEQGAMTYITTVKDFSNQGERTTVAIPSGYRALRMVYNMVETDLALYIDDIEIVFNDSYLDTPVAGFDPLTTSAITARVDNLDNGTTYVAYVSAVKADGSVSAASRAVEFTPDSKAGAGVGNVEADLAAVIAVKGDLIVPSQPDLRYNVFTPDGICIFRAATGQTRLPAPGLYIIVSGKTAMKAAVR